MTPGAASSFNIRFLFKVFMSLSGIGIVLIVLFYIGYKCLLRKQLEVEVGDRLNDTLSKYYTENQGTNTYRGANFKEAKGDPNNYGIEV